VAVPAVWFLNLDADHELARPLGYSPSKDVLARVAALRARVRADLFADGDLELVDGAALPTRSADNVGRAWCMTPRARKLLTAAGATPVDSPSLAVLQRVNSRAFAYALLAERDESICSDDPERLRDFVLAAPKGTRWLAKRAHGMAGRGQRRLTAGELDAPDLQWLAKSCAAGSVLIERRRELCIECVVHGEVDTRGEVRLGPVFEQRCDAQGAWLENIAQPAISAQEREHLLAASLLAARALFGAGYFGPFGLDSYAWIESGERRWNPLSDLNARYTMGWRRDQLAAAPDSAR
jgi:hypothetical protein